MAKLVLIVDDENDLIEYLKEIIESLDLGIEVIFATGGDEAVKLVKENLGDLDLIFLDMKMEDKHGLVVYEEVRELSDDVIIVFMSGDPLAELSSDPNVYFLPKPFTYDDIELLMEKISWN